MDLAAHIEACFQRRRLAHATGIVAVSGGPDSVALAHLLVGLLQAGKLERLILAHVNHQLRGEESDADETFVKNLPELWQQPNLICCTQRIDVAAIAHAEHDNLEAIARRERYRWLTQLAHEHQAAWIATGHTADDQAETVLFRLLRGSGVLGLSGMAECRMLDDRVTLVRPLLTVRRQALLDYLQAGQIPYRLDSSNRDRRFTRNRLRLELLPRLESEYNPAIVDVLCRLADQAAELHTDVLEQALQLTKVAELPRAGDILVFSADRLQRVSKNLMREMFRLVWQREAWPMGDMDFERWNRLVEIVQGSLPAWDFPGGIHMRRVGSVVQIHTPPAKSS
jgi:tRNA(Ile)-lysidine synthase